jgi:hypothetical protein
MQKPPSTSCFGGKNTGASSKHRISRQPPAKIEYQIQPPPERQKGQAHIPPTAVWMLRPEYRPWPSANARRLNPACHVASSVTLANAVHFTKPHTLARYRGFVQYGGGVKIPENSAGVKPGKKYL